jgi:xanthine dehydrogenase YagT iron-sulfur-binding subunit
MSEKVEVRLTINGSPKKVVVEPRESLLDVLRDVVLLTGPKKGCDESVCGACAVLVNGRAVCSCTMLAVEAEGSSVTTIEGLANGAQLHPLQRAFVDLDALQCGYCTSGQIIAAKSYLDHLESKVTSDDEIKEALSGNLCRCGCYNKIVEAVKSVAEGKLSSA